MNRLVEAARRRAIERARARIADALPDITVTATDAGVELSGRGLIRRMLSDARLRWIGGLLR